MQRDKSISAVGDPNWPALPFGAWKDTLDTLHMWTQIVGKIRLRLAPFENHFWNCALYVTTRGLTTSPIPHGERTFSLSFDFIHHRLRIFVDAGAYREMELGPRSVADFYGELMALLASLDLEVRIWPQPVESEITTPFFDDFAHASYDPVFVHRFWQALLQIERVLHVFRGGFVGKASPVHFWWGSFDLATSRFSGRPALPRTDADAINRAAYSHEVMSVGFWPGGGPVKAPMFYAYIAPEPADFARAPGLPEGTYYDTTLRELLLPYDVVRTSGAPQEVLLDFCNAAYRHAASMAHWDRASLELTSRSVDSP